MNARLLFLIGTIHWFLFASGHSLIVDIDFVVGTVVFALAAWSIAREHAQDAQAER